MSLSYRAQAVLAGFGSAAREKLQALWTEVHASVVYQEAGSKAISIDPWLPISMLFAYCYMGLLPAIAIGYIVYLVIRGEKTLGNGPERSEEKTIDFGEGFTIHYTPAGLATFILLFLSTGSIVTAFFLVWACLATRKFVTAIETLKAENEQLKTESQITGSDKL